MQACDFTRNLYFLLEETFESPVRKGGNAYLDKATGWYPSLEAITAEDASMSFTAAGTTIAGQLEHCRFYLEALESYRLGQGKKVDWEDSWSVRAVTPEEWESLKTEFKTSYERIRDSFKSDQVWTEDRVGEAMAILMHSAYHLGSIRQMLKLMT